MNKKCDIYKYLPLIYTIISLSWPCLHQWLETRPNKQTCPVCKAGISKDQVVPIYGRGSTDNKDPRYDTKTILHFSGCLPVYRLFSFSYGHFCEKKSLPYRGLKCIALTFG